MPFHLYGFVHFYFLYVFFCFLLDLLGNQQRDLDQRAVEVDIMNRKWYSGKTQWEKGCTLVKI